jgi:hypothetical protein
VRFLPSPGDRTSRALAARHALLFVRRRLSDAVIGRRGNVFFGETLECRADQSGPVPQSKLLDEGSEASVFGLGQAELHSQVTTDHGSPLSKCQTADRTSDTILAGGVSDKTNHVRLGVTVKNLRRIFRAPPAVS